MKKIPFLPLIAILITGFALNAGASDLTDYKKHGHKSAAWTPLVESGFSAMESGNLDAAMNFFKRAVEKGCRDGLVYFNMAVYNESGNNFENAYNYFKLAEKYLPGRYKSHDAAKSIHEHLGRVLYHMGRTDEAESELKKALTSQGDNFTVVFLLGSIAQGKGDDEGVITYYSKALTLPPPEESKPGKLQLTMLVEIGKSAYKLKDYEIAEAAFRQVLQIVPNHTLARQYLGYIQHQKMTDAVKESDKKILEEIIQ